MAHTRAKALSKVDGPNRTTSSPLRKPWAHLYKKASWKRLRARHLRDHPLCVACLQDGHVTLATVVDHKIPHKGNLGLFHNPTNLQSLCETHHNGDKQREENRGYSTAIGFDGFPIDPRADRRLK